MFISPGFSDNYTEFSSRTMEEIDQSDCDHSFKLIVNFMRISTHHLESYEINNKRNRINLEALLKTLELSQHKVENCFLRYGKNNSNISSALSSISIIVIDLRGWVSAKNFLIPSKVRMLDSYQNCIMRISEINFKST